jgi:3-phosphoshikimate 1-carboxyvinyltransferase
MIATIQPSTISGPIQAAASKSSMQRACAAALLFKGESMIKNPGHSNDDQAALKVIAALGATVKNENEALTISSNGVHALTSEVNCGESGLGLRMFAPIIALSEKEITVKGEGKFIDKTDGFLR